jgi:putative membrane protein
MWFERFHIGWVASSWWLVPAVFAACGLVAFPLARWWRVQRLFLSPLELLHSAQIRAELEFHREGLSQTVDRTGILLFLSVFERHAVVLADQGIASKLPPSTWEDVVKVILEGARAKNWEPKLAEAIRLCGGHLNAHFPIKPGDKNEISNAVVLKD